MVIFDEVDANLDAQYRTAVAGLLQSISSEAGTQFICTTFRPEMLVTADKFYGVTFNNQKVSSIRCIKREEAQEFVDQVRSEAPLGIILHVVPDMFALAGGPSSIRFQLNFH